MAKRKRASLKDKSPETLGLTQRKGKGIDLLFGGPVDKGASSTQPQSVDEATSGLVDDDSSLLSSESTADRPVDELGLPLALEEPPDDLILASAPVGGSATLISEEVDAVTPETSPFSIPTPSSSVTSASDAAADLSGILDEDNLPEVEDEKLANSEKRNRSDRHCRLK